MSFTVSFWTFAKEVNSTAVPSGTGTDFSCVANDGVDIINPVISLQRGFGGTNSPVAYNYCKIANFGNRYYFVENWEWSGGLWRAHCAVDVLATYKTEIGSMTAYVLRSSEEFDGRISDAMYPAKEEFSFSSTANSGQFNWITNLRGGTYIVGVNGDGATKFFAMDMMNFRGFVSYLLSDQYLEDVLGLFGSSLAPETKAIVDPLQYISSVILLPFTYNANAFTSQTFKVGYADVTFDVAEVDGTGSSILSTEKVTFTFNSLDHHPLSPTRGEYLNYAPWTKRFLWLPPFGMIELDCTQMENKITADVYVDTITGACRADIYGSYTVNNTTYDTLITELKTQLGVQIQLSQVISKGMGFLSIVQSAANVASQVMGGLTGGGGTGNMLSNVTGGDRVGGMRTGSAIGGAASFMSGTAGAIKNAIESQIPILHSTGSTGSLMDNVGTPYVKSVFTMPVDESRNTRGRPLCSERLLSTLAKNNYSGYILVADPDVNDIAATAAERDMVASFLVGGFYLA